MGSGLSSSWDRPSTEEEQNRQKKKKAAKIPLNIALVAIVRIQTQFRMYLARRRFEYIAEIVMEERRQKALEEEQEREAMEDATPMITSSMQGSTKSGKLNNRNRFIRKTVPSMDSGDDDSFQEHAFPSFDPGAILSKFTPYGKNSAIIYPLVGFVVKSRSASSGKKVMLNVCHHESIITMVATDVREVNDATAQMFAAGANMKLL
jgi:hypothetical protein